MAILSGHQIRTEIGHGEIEIDPYDPTRVQPNSVDLTLGTQVRVYEHCVHVSEGNVHSSSFTQSKRLKANFHSWDTMLDVKKENPVLHFEMDASGWALMPGTLYLMHTVERVHTKKFVTQLNGKSSIARLGVIVHFTAAFGETGFDGQYTLEVSAMHPVRLYPGMAICQAVFSTVFGSVEDYQKKGHYVGDAARGAEPSHSWEQFQ